MPALFFWAKPLLVANLFALRHLGLWIPKGRVMFFKTLTAAMALAAAPAAADLTLTGEAKMGLAFKHGELAAQSGAQMTARASGITDGGLEYGIIMDVDLSGFNQDDDPRAQVYIMGGDQD